MPPVPLPAKAPLLLLQGIRDTEVGPFPERDPAEPPMHMRKNILKERAVQEKPRAACANRQICTRLSMTRGQLQKNLCPEARHRSQSLLLTLQALRTPRPQCPLYAMGSFLWVPTTVRWVHTTWTLANPAPATPCMALMTVAIPLKPRVAPRSPHAQGRHHLPSFLPAAGPGQFLSKSHFLPARFRQPECPAPPCPAGKPWLCNARGRTLAAGLVQPGQS